MKKKKDEYITYFTPEYIYIPFDNQDLLSFNNNMEVYNNSYLGKRKIDTVITNSEKVSKTLLKKYETKEQKDLVPNDIENVKITNIRKPLVTIADGTLKHDSLKLGLEIMNTLTK